MSDPHTLSGKTAIVTGASSGIGQATALELAAVGAHVFLGGRTPARMEETAKQIEEAGGRATVVALDVREPAQVQNLVAGAVQQTGRLDILVNNAGVSYPSTIVDGYPERWRTMLETNVLALLVGSQAAIRAMRECGAEGHIVNISSVAGRRDATGVYGATKAAVNSIATTLRAELEEDTIRVVNILPGAVATNFARNFDPAVIEGFIKATGIEGVEFTPGEHLPDEVLERLAKIAQKTLARPEDIARAVLFAVTQPIELNVFELVVRPQRALTF